jgi:hypothetical protein
MTARLRLLPREEPWPPAAPPCDLAAVAAHLLGERVRVPTHRGDALAGVDWGPCEVPVFVRDVGSGG